jgi:predicted nuclease with RNAse H fold
MPTATDIANVPGVITVGVDLGAEPKRTAVAMLEWDHEGVRLLELLTTADDDTVLELALQADKTGIDCPLGWSDDFVEFVNAHHTGNVATTPVDSAARLPLRYRATDLFLIEEKLGRPLSVSSDLIAVPAMRAAGLLAAMIRSGIEVDRAGVTGGVAETYPALAVRHWKLDGGKYKGAGNEANLSAMVDRLRRGFRGRLDFGEHRSAVRRSDDAFDAVMCAMVARATTVYRGTAQIPRGLVQRARREGWIAVPTCRLDELIAPVEYAPSGQYSAVEPNNKHVKRRV